MDERISNLEDRINSIQVSLDVLPDILTRCIQQQFDTNNVQTSFGQHYLTNQPPHHHQQQQQQQQQQNSSHSTLSKQPIQPQGQQQQPPLALTHQQQHQPSSFQDGDFASLQIASSPSPNNPPAIGESLGNNATVLSGRHQQQSTTSGHQYPAPVQGQIWQYPQQNTTIPTSTSTTWQSTNPVPPVATIIGQSNPNLQQSHILNRPLPSVQSHQHSTAIISNTTPSSAATMTSSSSNAPPTNSQLLSAHQPAPQVLQNQPRHITPPPAYHVAAQSTGRVPSSNIPVIAPPPPLPPRSQLDASAKSMTTSLTATASEVFGATPVISSTTNVGFQPQQSSVRNRHSHHQDQQNNPSNTS